MDGIRHDHWSSQVVAKSVFDRLRRPRALNAVHALFDGRAYTKYLGCILFVLLIASGPLGCRSTKSPEDISTDAGDFVGKVIYNSAGAQSNEQLSQGYGVDCNACSGLGYYISQQSGDAEQRRPCPSCQGKGWRTP